MVRGAIKLVFWAEIPNFGQFSSAWLKILWDFLLGNSLQGNLELCLCEPVLNLRTPEIPIWVIEIICIS
jgi:hypothetical protein